MVEINKKLAAYVVSLFEDFKNVNTSKYIHVDHNIITR